MGCHLHNHDLRGVDHRLEQQRRVLQMSFVLFKDSFKRYDQAGNQSNAAFVANLRQRYTFVRGSNFGIDTTGSLPPEFTMLNAGLGKTLPHSSRWVCGHRYRYLSTGLANVSAIYQLFNNSSILFSLTQNADGTLAIFAGNYTPGNGTTLGVTNRSLFSNIRYYLEWDVTLSGSSPIICTAELRINGHVEASGSGSTTVTTSQLLSGNPDANLHEFAAPAGGLGTQSWIKDLYIKNEAGYEGDVRIVPIYPASDGGLLQWTPNSGTTHFDRVNTHPVDITKFLKTATPGNIDLWTFDTLPAFSGTIVGINISVLAQKDDEGTKSFKIVTGATGTDAQSDEFFVSSANPEYYEFSLKLDPQTGLPWTAAGVNALIAGVKCIS